MLARHVLYHFSYTPSPTLFALGIFHTGSFMFAHGWPQTVILIFPPSGVAGITEVIHHT
jgi:hypothetical protein